MKTRTCLLATLLAIGCAKSSTDTANPDDVGGEPAKKDHAPPEDNETPTAMGDLDGDEVMGEDAEPEAPAEEPDEEAFEDEDYDDEEAYRS